MVGPPYRLGVGVAILGPFPVVRRPNQPGQVGTGFRRFHLAQGFGQNWDSVALKCVQKNIFRYYSLARLPARGVQYHLAGCEMTWVNSMFLTKEI